MVTRVTTGLPARSRPETEPAEPDSARIRRNVAKMIEQGASQVEIDQYLQGERVSPAQARRGEHISGSLTGVTTSRADGRPGDRAAGHRGGVDPTAVIRRGDGRGLGFPGSSPFADRPGSPSRGTTAAPSASRPMTHVPCREGAHCRVTPYKLNQRPGRPVPPASRTYAIPEGYLRSIDPQNRFITNAKGEMVINPLYESAYKSGSWVDWKGVAKDLGSIALGTVLPLRGMAAASTFTPFSMVGVNGAKTMLELSKSNP